MKTALKVLSIVSIVLGGLALLGCLIGEGSVASFLGACVYLSQGIVALIYIKQNKAV